MLRLKEIRIDRGFTQESIASFLGISRAAYTNIENGKRDPDTNTLLLLADHYGVSVDYLLGRPHCNASSISDTELRLVNAYRQADPTYQAVALELLESHPAQSAKVARA